MRTLLLPFLFLFLLCVSSPADDAHPAPPANPELDRLKAEETRIQQAIADAEKNHRSLVDQLKAVPDEAKRIPRAKVAESGAAIAELEVRLKNCRDAIAADGLPRQFDNLVANVTMLDAYIVRARLWLSVRRIELDEAGKEADAKEIQTKIKEGEDNVAAASKDLRVCLDLLSNGNKVAVGQMESINKEIVTASADVFESEAKLVAATSEKEKAVLRERLDSARNLLAALRVRLKAIEDTLQGTGRGD